MCRITEMFIIDFILPRINMALINTHTAVKKFIKHGFTEEQAEVIVDVINDQNSSLTTKADLKILEVALKSEVTELKSEVSELKIELKWIKAALFAILGLLVKLVFFN